MGVETGGGVEEGERDLELWERKDERGERDRERDLREERNEKTL